MVVAALRFEPQTKGGPARPALVSPTPTPANTRRSSGRIQVRINAAGKFCVVPVPAPLVDVAVHIVQPPGVGRVTADSRGTAEGRPRLGAVVRPPFEIRL